jgi:hypothetical protein
MSTILLNQMPIMGKEDNVFAYGKARYDVNRICQAHNISVENIPCKFYKVPMMTTLRVLWLYHELLGRIRGGHDIVVQYPVSCPKAFFRAVNMMKRNGNRLIFLIHDINSFRYKRDNAKEIAMLNMADSLIVHTEAMASLLSQNGVRTPMHVLGLFDYLTDDAPIEETVLMAHRHEVVFAGNLVKSQFIPLLCKAQFHSVNFRLYGVKKSMDFSGYEHIEYGGVFDCEHTASITGGWGLVWDGDSLDGCHGALGDYLRYNLPHKLSLYLAAGLPVIVWKESAVAKMVVEHGLGIAVNSLSELPQAIDSISDQTYQNMIQQCRHIGEKLREGSMTLDAVRRAISKI